MGVADQESFCIVTGRGLWLLDFDYCVLSAGDDQAVWVLGVGRKVCDGVDELLAIGDDGAFEGGRRRRRFSPDSDGVVAGDGDDGVWFWESNIADLSGKKV